MEGQALAFGYNYIHTTAIYGDRDKKRVEKKKKMNLVRQFIFIVHDFRTLSVTRIVSAKKKKKKISGVNRRD